MFRVYIVDDEPLARDELKYLLARSKKAELIGESDGINRALPEILELEPDIVFLDIELSDDSGLALAKKLESLERPPVIVFATAYDEYAYQAFELNAVDYLLKPFDEERLEKSLDKASKLLHQSKKSFSITPSHLTGENSGKIPVLVAERIVILHLSDILFVESQDGKSLVHTVDRQYKVSEALVVFEKKLPPSQFLRVHRSYIVNLDHIVEIEPWFNSTYNLFLKNDAKVPVSRTFVKQMRQAIGLG